MKLDPDALAIWLAALIPACTFFLGGCAIIVWAMFF